MNTSGGIHDACAGRRKSIGNDVQLVMFEGDECNFTDARWNPWHPISQAWTLIPYLLKVV